MGHYEQVGDVQEWVWDDEVKAAPAKATPKARKATTRKVTTTKTATALVAPKKRGRPRKAKA